jgi:hypothetical protein
MLEKWNTGKMGFGLRLVEHTPRGAYASERIMECWVNGIIVLTIKLKTDNILEKTQCSIIPRFHYSIIEAKSQTAKNILYFHQVVEIPRRFN